MVTSFPPNSILRCRSPSCEFALTPFAPFLQVKLEQKAFLTRRRMAIAQFGWATFVPSLSLSHPPPPAFAHFSSQGMNFVAAFIIWRLQRHDEAEMFWLFCAVMKKTQRLFLDGELAGYTACMDLLAPLLRINCHRVVAHFKKIDVTMEMLNGIVGSWCVILIFWGVIAVDCTACRKVHV